MKLMEGFDSNYRYVLVAARRARQIQSGARPLMDQTHSRKACRIAEEEIAASEMPVPHELEERLVEETGDAAETVVAFVLARVSA